MTFDDGGKIGYGYSMSDPTDNDEHEKSGPSLAIPPVYVLRTATHCPECGQAQHVYTLGCAAYHDAEDSRPVNVFHFLRLTSSVPDELLLWLKSKWPGYFFDQDGADKRSYLINHCFCGAKLDDDYLHGDVGAAFWPDTPDGYRQLKVFRLPIVEPIPVDSSYVLGGDEYLDFDTAEPW